jgi:uncharacterized membrane protein
MSSSADDRLAPDPRPRLRDAFVTGLAITVPALVTVLVLFFAFDFLAGLLGPVTPLARRLVGPGGELPTYAIELLSAGLLGVIILAVGLTAESQYGGGALAGRFESFLSNIPGLGYIYRSVDEISTLLLESDTESFQEVKLVEYPTEGTYALGFLTAETPDVVRESTGHGEMVTLFMPMAPNPVMGGFVLHVADERVHDVDMTVQEGVQSIVSSGVAVDSTEGIDADSPTPPGAGQQGELL